MRIKYLLIVFLSIINSPAAFAKDLIEDSFAQIKSDVVHFYQDAHARRYRHRYDDLISRCEEFVKSWPEHPRAKEASDLANKLHAEIGEITGKKKLPELTSIATQDATKSIIVKLGLSGPVQVKQGEVPATKTASKRLFFDLKPLVLGVHVPGEIAINNRGLARIRTGQYAADTVRVVIEVASNIHAVLNKETQGVEIALGIKGQKMKPPAPSKAVAQKTVVEPVQQTPQKPPELKVIVLDPGHGGRDSGAIGRHGLKEKNVTLAIAMRLKKIIEKQLPKVKVYLTRHTDETVALKKRTELANKVQADLFVSIHVNSHSNPKAEGIETYYLNVGSDRYAKRLAARENAISETEVSNLEFILADLAMKSNVSDSVRLGKIVQSSILSKVSSKRRYVKDLGLKHALFYVLLGAKMPAILVESSFISNREEERRLKTAEYQDGIANGLAHGIRRFVDEKQAMNTR